MKFVPHILFFLAIKAAAQSLTGGPIQIKMENDSIQTSVSNPEVTISFRCENQSGTALLLYGIDAPVRLLPFKAEMWCDHERVSAGLALIIYNNQLKQKPPMHYIHSDKKLDPMSTERLDSLMKISKLNYYTTTKVLEAHETVNLKKTIKLHEYNLERGIYFLQLVYFSGKQVTTLVEMSQIDSDRKIHKAELYQGCAISNRISIIID